LRPRESAEDLAMAVQELLLSPNQRRKEVEQEMTAGPAANQRRRESNAEAARRAGARSAGDGESPEFATGSWDAPLLLPVPFISDMRSSSSVPYSAFLLRVRKEELVVVFLHCGVSVRPVQQATEIPSPPFVPSSWI
jgi:hypothetical protein